MGKRSDFERRPRDFYPTPDAAVVPLLPHLPKDTWFCEPCAGDGQLVRSIEKGVDGAVCFWAYDIEPQSDEIGQLDAVLLEEKHLDLCDMIITNPPFEWKVLAPIMDKFISLRPTVLLLPADFMHNQRFAPYMEKCYKVVSIGRVKWIEGSKMTSTENFCWYFFNNKSTKKTEFYGR